MAGGSSMFKTVTSFILCTPLAAFGPQRKPFGIFAYTRPRYRLRDRLTLHVCPGRVHGQRTKEAILLNDHRQINKPAVTIHLPTLARGGSKA
ncbi:hypothetical protein BJV74DRAFT_240977 [Russula compacta]|nr:hypothetical protein BJV74DRAFT_240977 [Russula compacta]